MQVRSFTLLQRFGMEYVGASDFSKMISRATRMQVLRVWGPIVGTAVALAAASHVAGKETGPLSARPTAPPTLAETGLYAESATLRVDPAHLGFAPQYPLWTDGAAKRRWISLPAGTSIDASDPEAWVFPVGTRFWKEFAFDGRPVETRYLEHLADGQWLYAAYGWSPDGRSAELVSENGRRGAYPLAGGRSHSIPSVSDCKVCHESGASPVLGFGALQLSPDRDPGALHVEPAPPPGVDLADLVRHGLIEGLPAHVASAPPRIAATSPIERAAIGYLHGNCGHCHNDTGGLRKLGLVLRHPASSADSPAVASSVGQPVRERAPGQSPDAVLRIEPSHPERSGLAQRIGSRYPLMQMPPLGTELVDEEAVQLLARWITEMDQTGPSAHQGE